MIDALEETPPIFFWIIGREALLWNLVGLMFYYMQVTMPPNDLAVLTEAQQAFLLNAPVWATSAHAIAVNAGILGSLLLLLRKSWAVPLYVLSLIGIIVQDLDAFVIRDALTVWGSDGILLPSIVIAIAVALVLYSRSAKAKRWLS